MFLSVLIPGGVRGCDVERRPYRKVLSSSPECEHQLSDLLVPTNLALVLL